MHFPTDLNLLWDSSRKCLDMIDKLQRETKLPGWRKIKHIRKTIKSIYRATSFQVFKGRKESHKKQSVKLYLEHTQSLVDRCKIILENRADLALASASGMLAMLGLEEYTAYAVKMIDLVHRRLIKDEVIPAAEKIYSIFEPHTECLPDCVIQAGITKGKLNKKVELGHLLLITTDAHQFIVDYKVMEDGRDASQVSSLNERIKEKFKDRKIYSHSFDKGFYSKENLNLLQQSGIDEVMLPKRGKLNKEEKLREGTKEFRQLRYGHSAVESNINMLEHHGLNRCVDKGLYGYKRYVGLSVLAYNLHILGNSLVALEKQKEEKQRKKELKRPKLAA